MFSMKLIFLAFILAFVAQEAFGQLNLGDKCDKPQYCNGIKCPKGKVPICLAAELVCACVAVDLAPILSLGK